MHDLRFVLRKLGRGGLRQNTTDFTKFITLTTCFGHCGPSSDHRPAAAETCRQRNKLGKISCVLT